MADILVVDDDQAIAEAFEQFLVFEGHQFRAANSALAGLRAIDERTPDLVFMDVRMPGMDGLTALQQFKQAHPGLCIVIMTAYGTSQTSIDAIRSGAFEYLAKPLDLDDLRSVIDLALAGQRVALGTSAGAAAPGGAALIGQSPAMLEVYKLIGRLATNSVPALIRGERGTGKRLVMATIHANSDRRHEPFVALSGAAAGEADLGAALAVTGTAAIAEVEQLSAPLQERLSQALAAARAPGAARPRTRVLASTEGDLAALVADGRVSRALVEELGVITVRLPPLRERPDDIGLLVAHFLQRFSDELSRPLRGVDADVSAALRGHAWPGNVAELERVLKRAAIVARGDIITLADLGDSLAASPPEQRRDVEGVLEQAVRDALHERLVQGAAPSPYHQIVDTVETTLVAEALTITSGNQVKAAEILGVNRATLRKKMPLTPDGQSADTRTR